MISPVQRLLICVGKRQFKSLDKTQHQGIEIQRHQFFAPFSRIVNPGNQSVIISPTFVAGILNFTQGCQIGIYDRFDRRGLFAGLGQTGIKRVIANFIENFGAPQQDRIKQSSLATEMIIGQRQINVGTGCDLPQRYAVKASLGKQLFRSVQNPVLAVFFSRRFWRVVYGQFDVQNAVPIHNFDPISYAVSKPARQIMRVQT